MINKNLNDKVFDIMIEEAMEKYAQDVANEEIICDMTDEEINLMERRKDLIYKKTMAKIKGRRCSWKKLVMVGAAAALLMGLALNTSAVRKFLSKTKIEIDGSSLYITTSKIDESRYDSITEFIYKDELIVPDWLPAGTELAEITDSSVNVYLRFNNGAKWIDLRQRKKGEVTEWVETEKHKFDFTECNILGMDGQLVDITSSVDITTYTAVWSSDNVDYELATNYDKQTTEKILKNLKFYN